MVDDRTARRLITAARKGGEWVERRDRLIVEALENGGTQAEVGKLVGLTQSAISQILAKAKGGSDAS